MCHISRHFCIKCRFNISSKSLSKIDDIEWARHKSFAWRKSQQSAVLSQAKQLDLRGFSNGLSCLQVIAFIYYSYVKPVAHREIQESQYLTPGKRATAVCVYEDLFLPPQRCSAPLSWGTTCDINAIYTSLKSSFSGLQFRCWQYGIRLFV